MKARRNIALFSVAAMGVGALTYSLLAKLGSQVPGAGFTLLWIALLATGAWGITSYVFPSWVPSLPYQINRDLAYAGTVGVVAYGGLLGLGLLTIAATPLVWGGALISFASGSPAFGAIYGTAFGLGRSIPLVHGFRRGVEDSVTRVTRTVGAATGSLRYVGLGTGVFLVALGGTRLV